MPRVPRCLCGICRLCLHRAEQHRWRWRQTLNIGQIDKELSRILRKLSRPVLMFDCIPWRRHIYDRVTRQRYE